jgi:hypothetical protein
MIWASALRLFLIRNLLDPAGKKILLMNPVTCGGITQAMPGARRLVKCRGKGARA